MKVNINSAYFPLSTLRKYSPSKRDLNICSVKHFQDINNSYNIEMPENFHISNLNYNPRTKVSKYIENLKTSESVLNDSNTFINTIKKIETIKFDNNLLKKFNNNSKDVKVESFGDIDLKEKTTRLLNYNFSNKVELKEMNKAIENFKSLENKCIKLPFQIKKVTNSKIDNMNENLTIINENIDDEIIKIGEKNIRDPKRGKHLNFENVNIKDGVFGHLKPNIKSKLNNIKNYENFKLNNSNKYILKNETINEMHKNKDNLHNSNDLIKEEYFDIHPKQSAYIKNLNDFSIKEAYFKHEKEIIIKKKPVMTYDCIDHKSKIINNLSISTPSVCKYQKK